MTRDEPSQCEGRCGRGGASLRADDGQRLPWVACCRAIASDMGCRSVRARPWPLVSTPRLDVPAGCAPCRYAGWGHMWRRATLRAGAAGNATGAAAPRPDAAALSRACTRLARAWLLHAFWFAAMCVFAWQFRESAGLKIALLLALLTVPPVLLHAARVHRLCRALDPNAGTIGLVPMLVMTVVFTPFESGLVVPAKNLLAARGVLRRMTAASAPPGAAETPSRT